MKLLTHNLLSSRFLKGVNSGYPLILAVEKVEKVSMEYNPQLLETAYKKVDYSALKDAAKVCGITLPDVEASGDNSLQILGTDKMKEIFTALFNVEVITGTLTCPESGKIFPITDGIPNMLCNEDE